MIDIAVHSLKKNFGDFELLRDIDFEIYQGEKAGIIGKNGAGKTTLLNLIRDQARLPSGANIDEGEILLNSRARLGLIDQLPDFPRDYKVEDVLRLAFRRFDRMREEMTRLEKEISEHSTPALLSRYGAIAGDFEHSGGYETEYELSRVTTGLGIDAQMRAQDFYSLSGGEQTRVNLARVILEKSDILLLDEPTNHLDIASVEWLAEYVNSYKGTVLLISHDRWFLDQVCRRIIEIENGISSDYFGNYSYYAVERERRWQEALKLWEEQMEEKKRLEAMARRYRSWATEQAIHKAKVVEHKIERMNIADRPRRERKFYAKLDEAGFRADEALKLTDIHKSFDGVPVLRGISGLVGAGERICIYGPNGCGKSTLIKIITGELEADRGAVRFGLQTKWAYLPQIVKFDHMHRSVLDTVLHALPVSVQQARDRLGAFKFVGEDVFKPLSVLSGGELSRLKLCIVMYNELNFLILDEPTNHLDLASREWLEDLLDGFSGVILFVSHDRYFVTRFATRVWEMENGLIQDFKMGFEPYRERKKQLEESARAQGKPEKREIPAAKPAASAQNSDPLKNTGRDQKKQERIRENARREAMALEYQIRGLDAMIESKASDYQALQALLEEKEKAEEALLVCYEQMEA